VQASPLIRDNIARLFAAHFLAAAYPSFCLTACPIPHALTCVRFTGETAQVTSPGYLLRLTRHQIAHHRHP
jgi:hypothetical protein